MKKLIPALFALFLPVFAQAQSIHQESIFPGLTGNELLDSLAVYYAPSTILSYNDARDIMYTFIDNENNELVCIYTRDVIGLSQSSTNPRGELFDAGWNTEHIWPQSKGASTGLARRDIHHLRPIRADVNSSRGNKPFGYLEPNEVSRWWRGDVNQAAAPADDLTTWSRTGSTFFQVRDEDKGFTARAMFYFITFYTSDAMLADPDYFEIQMETLRRYHNESIVTEYEVDRTFRTETIQGNINPFIADTTLVRRAFFEDFDPTDGFGSMGYFVDFETGFKEPGGYVPGVITLNDKQWTFSNALIGGSESDQVMGSRSVRMRHQTGATDPETFIRMDEDKESGLGTVSFMYARSGFSGDQNPTAPQIVVEYSTNGGGSWTQAGSPIDLNGVNSFQTASVPVNVEESGRVRIRSISGSDGRRFNIDNFRITDFSTVTLPVLGDVSLIETEETEITVTSEVLNEGGGSVHTRGFLISEGIVNNDPVLGDSDAVQFNTGSGIGVFTNTLTGLQPNTEYVIKSFAVNEAGASYAEEIFVTTGSGSAESETAFQDAFNGPQNASYLTGGNISFTPWTITRSGDNWGARIFGNILELTNNAASVDNENGWVFVHTDANEFEKGFLPIPDYNFGLLSWSFNMRQIRTNPAGFGSNSYGVAFVLGATSANVATEGSGYAVVLGNTGTPDPVHLVHFEDGLQSLGFSYSSNVIVGAPTGSALEDPSDGYSSIKVTYNPSNSTWRLYGRLDGSSFQNPLDGELEFLGQATNSLFTDEELEYVGAYWQGSTAGNQTAFFDNVTIDIEPVDFTFTTTLEGAEGWRLLGAPTTGASFADFLNPFWTQGFPGADISHGSPNLFFYSWNHTSGEGFYAPESASDETTPGMGYLVYIYEKDDNVSGSFPKEWELTGPAAVTDVPVEINPVDGGFTLVSNPYPVPLDWALVLNENPDINAVIYVYDHGFNDSPEGDDVILPAGGYRTWNGFAGSLGSYMIAPYQGFWIESSGNDGELTIPASARVFGESPAFYSTNDAFKIVAGHESGIHSELWISFGDEGSTAGNRFDALAMSPLEFAPHVQAFFQASSNLSSKHLPVSFEETVQLPLHVQALSPAENTNFGYLDGQMKLEWETPSHLSEYRVTLIDHVTGITVDMAEVQKYEWESVTSGKTAGEFSFGSLSVNTDEARFSIIIEPQTTNTEVVDKPLVTDLHQNYPNPFNPSTNIRFTLKEGGNTRLTVYTISGQRVAELASGYYQQGSHTITFDAGNLASGVYLYRLETGGQVQTRKMMLVK